MRFLLILSIGIIATCIVFLLVPLIDLLPPEIQTPIILVLLVIVAIALLASVTK